MTKVFKDDQLLDRSRRFWDAKAAENPYWYVSSCGPYEHCDIGAFWASGVQIWIDLKTAIGYAPKLNDKVVEIGCGVGRLTRAIARDIGHVYSIDISAEMVEMARKAKLPNVDFYVIDGVTLAPLTDGCADCTIAYSVYQHLPSIGVLEAYLDEMLRLTRPTGILAFTLSPRTWHVALLSLVKIKRWLKEGFSPDGPTELYRREWLGIRPSAKTVRSLCRVNLQQSMLHGNKWLFWGRRPTD